MKRFYAVYVADGETRRQLAALRFLCDPAQKHLPHITVRGPYVQPLKREKIDHLSALVEGTGVIADGVDCFFGPQQHTVFVPCEGEGIARVWSKPGLGYRPHMTLYDGHSREYATALLTCLASCALHLTFPVTGLHDIVSHPGQGSQLLEGAFDTRYVSAIVGQNLDPEQVRRLRDTDRLPLVKAVAQAIMASLPAGSRSYSSAPAFRRQIAAG